MVYILILIYIFFLVIRYDVRNFNEGKNTNYHILWGVFVLVAGLSYHVGGDSIGYEISFNNYRFVHSLDDVYDGDLLANSKEPLWVLVNILFFKVFGDFQFLKFAIALFFNTTVFWFVKKHSSKPFFSILLYAVILGLHLNFQVLRESVAIGFFLIAFDNLCGEKKKYFRYYLLIIIAFLFHRFAFVLVIVPLFNIIRMNWGFYAILAFFLFAGPVVNTLMVESGLFLLNDSLARSFEGFMNSDEYGAESLTIFGIAATLLKLIPLWVLIFYCKDCFIRRTSCAYFLVYVLNIVSIGIFYRFNDFFLFPFVVTAAESFKNINRPSKIKTEMARYSRPALNIIIVLYLVFTIVGNITYKRSFEYFPYSSVITKHVVQERENLLYYMW